MPTEQRAQQDSPTPRTITAYARDVGAKKQKVLGEMSLLLSTSKLGLRYRSQILWSLLKRLSCRPNLGLAPGSDKCSLKIAVINLQERVDRRNEIEKHFGIRNLEFSFIPGVKHAIPLAGCAQAHIQAMRKWAPEDFEILMICEDDIEFLKPQWYIDKLILEFCKNPALDVLCLGNSTRKPLVPISASLAISDDIQTASCYLLKRSGVSKIAPLFEYSSKMLQDGNDHRLYAHDVLWKQLQRNSMIFAVPRKSVARQKKSFSDIQMKVVNYGV